MAYTSNTSERVRVPFRYQLNTQVWNNGYNFTLNNSRTGEKVIDWKSKVQAGLQAGSPFATDRRKILLGDMVEEYALYQDIFHIPPNGTYLATARGYPGYDQGDSNIAHLSASQTKARSLALSKLYKKLEEEVSQMNAPAVIGEFGDVLRQFGAPFEAITGALDKHLNRLQYEKRRLSGPIAWRRAKMLQIAASTWLETSFGLLPLISDTRSAAEAFARLQYEVTDLPSLRKRMRTRAETSATSVAAAYPWTFGYYQFVLSQKTETLARAQYVIGLDGEVRAEFGSNERLLQLLGFDHRNFTVAAWEVIPWSWFLDYWANIQQILQAGATGTSRVKWIVLTETLKTTVTRRSKLVSVQPPANQKLISRRTTLIPGSGTDKTCLPNEVKFVRTTLNRTLPATLGVPPLYFKTPFEDLKKMTNMAAVLLARKRESNIWLF